MNNRRTLTKCLNCPNHYFVEHNVRKTFCSGKCVNEYPHKQATRTKILWGTICFLSIISLLSISYIASEKINKKDELSLKVAPVTQPVETTKNKDNFIFNFPKLK